MSDVFISYSREDRAVAAALASDLERSRIDAWWDFEVYAGQDFHDTILTALDEAKAVIVIWSDTAARSPWVRDEATRAARHNKLVTAHVPSFDLQNLPLGFGQRHSSDVHDRQAIIRALANHGVIAGYRTEESRADRGRRLLAQLRDIKSRREAANANQQRALNATPDQTLGIDPASKKTVVLRDGRFGPYVQLGSQGEDGQPKRAAVPRDIDVKHIDLMRALQLLSLPRELGTHPETGKPVIAGIGRYGPFLMHDGTYANLDRSEEVFSMSLVLATALLADRGDKRGPWQAPTLVKELGDHPTKGGPVLILSGRFGPYLKHGTTNATVPRGTRLEEVTLARAIEWLTDREARNR